MPTVTANGIDVHYERAGAGPRLLVITGSGSSVRASAALIAPFRDHFDTVAYDQRGLGRTTIPPGPYTMADYARDAIALLDAIGWATCRVIGVSFGGMVAQELAVTVPERIERLALLCTSPGGAGGSSYPLHELAERSEAERAELALRLLDERFDDDWLARHPGDRALVEARSAAGSTPMSAEQRRGAAAQLEARRHHDVWARLPRVTCPTFVAAGVFDPIAPVSNSESIASRLPDGTLRTYLGGHLFFFQDRQALPDVIAFLRQDG